MRNVMIVVPVLMTSCQVSLKLNSGPVTAHTTITPTAIANADGVPDMCEVHLAKWLNLEVDFVAFIVWLSCG